MNRNDLHTLTEKWHAETNYINDRLDEAFRLAQDDAYALGVKRGKEEAKARYEPRPRLSDDRIDCIAEQMPGGWDGFRKDWGYRQFARAIEADHGIVDCEPLREDG